MNALRRGIRASATGDIARTGPETVARRYRFAPDFIGFSGHFPGNPILPAIVQVCAVVSLAEEEEGKPLRLAAVRSAKFLSPIRPGEEVSTSIYGHFNIFPAAVLAAPNGGAVNWYFKESPELFRLMRANPASPLIQVNHPRSGIGSGYFASIGLVPSTLTSSLRKPSEFVTDFDAIEVMNGKRVDSTEAQVMPDWFGFLNRGYRVTGNGNSDSHGAKTSEVGSPRNYVQVGTDDPQTLDPARFIAAVKAGKVTVSLGPFVTVSVNGKGLGELAPLDQGEAKFAVVMQAPAWEGPIETIELLKNGQVLTQVSVSPQDADPANPTIRWRGVLTDRPAQDAWYLVRARSAGGNLGPLSGGRPYAFTNPVYVDADGNAAFDAPVK